VLRLFRTQAPQEDGYQCCNQNGDNAQQKHRVVP
jgi:hypothetical protein